MGKEVGVPNPRIALETTNETTYPVWTAPGRPDSGVLALSGELLIGADGRLSIRGDDGTVYDMAACVEAYCLGRDLYNVSLSVGPRSIDQGKGEG